MAKPSKRKVKLLKKPSDLLFLLVIAVLLVCGFVVYLILNNRHKVPSAATDPLINDIDSVLYDLTANHDGKICGVSGYDWELHAANQGGVPGSGFTKGTGWGVFQWDCNAGPVPNVTIETQNIRGYVFNGSWNLITDHASWCSLTDQTTATNIGDCPGGGLTGPNWQMPNSKVALHWASDHNNLPAGVTCAFTTLQARISGSGVAGAYVMGGSGFDYWNTANTSIDPSFVGRYKRLNGGWQWINGSSCPTTTIQNNPPPGVVVSAVSPPTPTPTPTPVVANSPTPITTPSNSFKVDYFDNQTLSGSPAYSTNTTNINYNWGPASPATGVGADHFSARYTGLFNFNGSAYKFNATSDDGIRVYLDGQLIIDSWKDQAATAYSVSKTPISGNHTVTVEYYENGYDATLAVNWAQVVVPTPSPTPLALPTTPIGTLNVFTAEYFNNMTLSGVPAAKNSTAAINYDWGTAKPVTAITADNFSVRWSGDFDFQAGNYTFTATSDDGVRVWVDGVKTLDKWIDQGPTSYSFGRNFASAGTHKIVVEYYEHCCGAVAKFAWTNSVQTVNPIVTEAEGMQLSGGTYVDSSNNIFSDLLASGRKGRVLWSNGAITGQVNSPITKITVRAKANMCDVAPNMIVKIDNVVVVQTSVNSKTWTDYLATVNIAPGVHTLAVGFDNDGWTSCDRNLRVDKVTIQ